MGAAAAFIDHILHEVSIMDETGDTKITWDPRVPDEVDNARKTFRDLIARNFLAYTVNPKNAQQKEQTREFDPNAAMYIFVPQMMGG